MSGAKSVPAGEVIEVVNPFDLKAIGTVEIRTWDQIDRYLATASQLHAKRKNWLPVYKRIEILNKVMAM